LLKQPSLPIQLAAEMLQKNNYAIQRHYRNVKLY